MLGDSLARRKIDHGQPDLDDLADRAGRRVACPTGRFDIDDVEQRGGAIHLGEGTEVRQRGSIEFPIAENDPGYRSYI
ncbi:hypothetical protein [Nocardia sp. CA-119907]|uniref:hypothetical protein n=1 Tax=Nocardia sp. CA-119907 TaxID=3239973 RepID=UPI003D954B8A